MQIRTQSLLIGVLFALASPAVRASEFVATLTLDGLSFVSFQDEETLPIPAGSTIRFRFDEPSNGSVPFTIRPEDVSIGPISLSGGRSLRYALASATSGVVRREGQSWSLQFQGAIAATVQGGGDRDGTFIYSIPFTTESASASDRTQTRSVQVSGMRLVDGAWYTQIVGATVNRENAFPKPGAAVYTVLSGAFDRFPSAAP